MNRCTGFTLFIRLISIVLAVFSSTIHAQRLATHVAPPTTSAVDQPETWITVFVHGMMSVKHHISLDNFMRFLSDDVEDSVYSRTVSIMRENPHFYQNQAMQRPGFHPVDKNAVAQGNAATALALLFDEMLIKSGHDSTHNLYFTFGWSGLLSMKARYRDAKELFAALEQEVRKLKARGINPRVRVIGYSHGGNVSLNLAAVRENLHPESELVIHELILLGMPVQHETARFVNHPMFENIYNIYSRADRVQIVDLFSTHTLFSSRIFNRCVTADAAPKIRQIELKVTSCTRSARLDPVRVANAGNFERRSIVSGKSRLLHDMSPGHAELWFFGWTPLNYRIDYPLYPLPTVCVVPFITKHTSTIVTDQLLQPIICDVRPEHSAMVVKAHGSGKLYTVAPFISPQEKSELSELIAPFEPEDYTEKFYRAQIAEAFRKASAEYTLLNPRPGTNRHPLLGRIKSNLLNTSLSIQENNTPQIGMK
jgi:hypothetical protein